jgi:ABC-type nitrate/sulfonate/bicarbonate transport system substrate-binding protein
VELDVRRLANGSQVSQALAAGELDVGVGGHIQTLVAAAAGADQGFIAPLGFERSPDHLPIALVARAGIHGARELEGAAVAVSAIAAISELQLRIYMAGHGCSYERLTLRAMPFGEVAEAFRRGEVAAASCPDPFAAAIVGAGLAAVIDRGSLSDALPDGERVMIAGLATSREWLATNRQAAVGIVEAVTRAIDDLCARASDRQDGGHLPYFDRGLAEADLQRVFDCAYEHGLADRRVDAGELVFAVS